MNNEVSLLKLNLDEEIIEKEELSSKRRREGSYSKKAILNLKKTEINESDKKIEKIINAILSENNIQLNGLIDIPISDKFPFDGTLFSYVIKKQIKTEKDNYFLIHYLKFYDTFNYLLTKIYNNEEKIFLFSQIINKIAIEEKQEKDILYKIGDISEKFYFLLKGTAIRLNTVEYESNMNKFEFFLFMKYLYKINENKLFNIILTKNEEIFDKYELLYFILEDKRIKFSGESLKQIKRMETSYVLERLIPNKMIEMNFNNDKKIVLSESSKTLDDILKGDDVVPINEVHLKKINIPIKEYLEYLKPISFNEENEELIRKKVILYTYDIDKEIKVGEHLEELDLKKFQKRNSTVICNRDCILGCLIKKEYLSCLKITQTKFHKNDINFLLSNELFSMMNFREFDKNYYHLFEFKKMRQNETLFEQGEKNNNIFFLKKGEISITFEGSFNDIYRIIGLKGGPKNRKMLDINYIKRFHSINIDENFFQEKQLFTLFKVKENFPIGFDDFIDKENENKILFNAYCLMDSEVFKISRENFNEIIYKENEVRKMKNIYVVKRNNMLIDELNIKKNGLIQKYINGEFNIKLELPYLFDESPLLFKSKNIHKKYLTRPNRLKNELIKIDTKLNEKLFNEMKTVIKAQQDKEHIEIQKYRYLNSENNKSFKNFNSNINFSNLNTKSKSNTNRRGTKSFKIMNIKDFSKKNKINKEILNLLENENSNEISNSKKKNKQDLLDPYNKIYISLKNDSKNRVTDFSYLDILMPPHPNKQISKSKKNIYSEKLKNINFQDNSIQKIDSERSVVNKKEELKNLGSSIGIVNKKSINEKPKLNFENFHLNKFIFFNERLSKIFVRTDIKNDSKENDKKGNINDNNLKLPKINNK